MVLAALKTIFAQPSKAEAHQQLEDVAKTLENSCPKVSVLLRDAADDVLAYMAIPEEHWRQIHSTNAIERQNKEIRRRTRVIGIFPDRASTLRLVTMLMWEQHDEWQVMSKAYFSKASMVRLRGTASPPALMKESATA